MMIKAILIDDEQDSTDVLSSLLQRYCPAVQVLACMNNPFEAAAVVEEMQPNVVFLDIEMPGKNGFELLEELDHPRLHIVFVTAYQEYAIRAFKYHAFDYLLKPVAIDALQKTIADLQTRMAGAAAVPAYADVLKKYLPLLQTRKIALPDGNAMMLVNPSDIIRCQSSGNYTRVYLQNGKNLLITRTLKEYEEMLAPFAFFRIHHEHLVNMQHVLRYIKGEGGYVAMSDGCTVEVSKRKKAAFLESLQHG